MKAKEYLQNVTPLVREGIVYYELASVKILSKEEYIEYLKKNNIDGVEVNY